MLLAGCPFEFEKEPSENQPPFAFFNVAPPDTTFANEAFYSWLGTDRDSDVVAYQYQLVETDSLYYFSRGTQGRVLRSIDPRREFASPDEPTEIWSDRTLDNFTSFSELPDGWYEMRARAIDAGGTPSPPAKARLYVFFDDIPPLPIIVDPRPGTSSTPACGRIGVSSWTFFIDATDESRSQTTPRTALEYSYQLRAKSAANCSTHLTDAFTEWRPFPTGGLPIEVGNAPPTLYTDLFDVNCGWDLTLRVRDPAGNVASTVCCVARSAVGCG